MDIYYDPETQEQLSRRELCTRLNASIPENTKEVAGWYSVTQAAMPEYNPAFTVTQGPVELIDGQYVQTWTQTARASEEILSSAAASVRTQRNAALAASDYLLMADYPLGTDSLEQVKNYRQALRDIPAQEGFPFDVVWPELPAILNAS